MPSYDYMETFSFLDFLSIATTDPNTLFSLAVLLLERLGEVRQRESPVTPTQLLS